MSLCLVAAASAGGQQPRQGGTIDVQFDLHTHPGGASAGGDQSLVTINVHLTILAAGVSLERDGKFTFQAAGDYKLDSFAALPAGTVRNDERRHDTLRGTGTVADDGTLTARGC
jgi:hypothetical protein